MATFSYYYGSYGSCTQKFPNDNYQQPVCIIVSWPQDNNMLLCANNVNLHGLLQHNNLHNVKRIYIQSIDLSSELYCHIGHIMSKCIQEYYNYIIYYGARMGR